MSNNGLTNGGGLITNNCVTTISNGIGNGTYGSYGNVSMEYTTSYYNTPYKTFEKNNRKYLQYELAGMDGNMLTDEKEYVNKTKQTTLTIKGSYENEYSEHKKEVNIRIPIDTEIYDGYILKMENGILTVILTEILNQQPTFRRKVDI